MTNAEKLMPCPFCGCEASAEGHVRFHRGAPNSWWKDGTPVEEAYFCNCLNCGISNSNIIGGHQSKADAIRAWNTRALPKVKALEWENSLNGRWIGTPPVKLANMAFWVFSCSEGFKRPAGDGRPLYYRTLEAAKAAAQADYEARILATLA